MIITDQPTNIVELLNSKAYMKPNSPIVYPTPEQIFGRFVELCDSSSYPIRYKVQNPVSNANSDGSINVSYPRVLIEANMRSFSEHSSTIGAILALDLQQPIVKIYSGSRVSACTNLVISGATFIQQHSVLGNLDFIQETILNFMNSKNTEQESYSQLVNRLKDIRYSYSNIPEVLGNILMLSTKPGTQYPVGLVNNASKLLQTKNSPYYVQEGRNTNAWNIYNAFTQGITDSADILYEPNKSWKTMQLFLN